MIERLLRLSAILIGVLALIDPPVTVESRGRPRVSVVVQHGPSMELPAALGPGTRRAAADRVLDTLRTDLDKDFDVVAGGLDPSREEAIIIGDHYPRTLPPANVNFSTVTVSGPLRPNVRIAAVDAPRAVPLVTSVRIAVTLEGSGVRGSTTTIVVRAGGADVGHESHEWTADEETWTGEVVAVPVGDPPFTFEIDADPLATERTPLDNRAIIRVEQAPRLRVFVLEARPSWASAFVRRALEGDPRFEVSGLSRVSPRGTILTGAAPRPTGPAVRPAAVTAGASTFDRFDTVLVGGLDSLTAVDVGLLERFMIERGGTVALLPDSQPSSGVVRRLLSGVDLRERLLERPAALTASHGLPRVDASELLEAFELPARSFTLARRGSAGRPVVWIVTRGEGQLLFSGAIDAWRYRAESGVEFDRFWRSTISGLALAARPPVTVDIEPRRAAVGERIRVVASVRRLERDRFKDALSIAAHAGMSRRIRLWPQAATGVFSGDIVSDAGNIDGHGGAGTVDESMVVATLAHGESGAARLVIDGNPREVDGPPLSLLAESHAGVNVNADDLGRLERHLKASLEKPSTRAQHHPMRSAWWFGPFAGCLCGEWWLRRRARRADDALSEGATASRRESASITQG